ncbi:MAG TPA: flagellar basal body-associated FliL family protein [Cellvibrio sp.]|nr:flagellar basal body-associated FliL family protein [Cellvibrio sp.]
MKNCWARIAGALLGLVASFSFASGGGNAPAEGVNYIAITPPLIVNYGGPGKVRYIKAELSLRAENATDAGEIMHHLPLIRDRLVSILSAQTEEVISTAEGKEYLRVYALAEINKALLKVEGHEHHDVEHESDDKKHVNEDHEKPKKTDAHMTQSAAAGAESSVPASPSVADVKTVKGPASDLFFNNFVVQK